MSDTGTITAAAPKKTRKASGPRQAKPMFAIVTGATDKNGNAVSLDRSSLKITLERDPAKIVELLSGEGASDSVVVRADMPTPAAKPAAAK